MKYVKSIPRLFFMSSIMKSVNFHSKKAQNSLKIKCHSTEAGEGSFFQPHIQMINNVLMM